MRASANGDNMLYELAQTMTAGGRHSAATALRKLAQAGYTSLEQVDSTSDWILLPIPGIGTKRLAEVRRLSRSSWQPPSSQAIQATRWFLSATQFALRYWTPETLASLVRGLTAAKSPGGPADKQLAIDVFSEAARKAQRYCSVEELVQALWQVRLGCSESPSLAQQLPSGPSLQPQASYGSQVETPASSLPGMLREQEDAAQDNDHFAHPRHKRIEIVRRYWIARENREIKNKDAWARTQYQISGKTLLCYEREFQDQRQAILGAADGEWGIQR